MISRALPLNYWFKLLRHKYRKTIQARQHASTHPHTLQSTNPSHTHRTHTHSCDQWSWVQIFPQTHPISWRSAHERGYGVPVCSYKHTLQTAMEQVHPNWECLTRKRLNQLVNKRVHPSPHHLDLRLSLQPTPLLFPSLWDLIEEIHLCRLVARLVSAHRSK